MSGQKLIDYCSAKKGATIDFPFDDKVMVFKVMGKMFALTDVSKLEAMNLKCDPDYAQVLRRQYPGEIINGYHMNSKHWNTVSLTGTLSEAFIFQLVDHSWDMVVKGLKKAEREILGYQ